MILWYNKNMLSSAIPKLEGTFEERKERIIANLIKMNATADDLEKFERAYSFSYDSHEGQFRKSGEPYFIHPLAVAFILSELEMDLTSIIAGLLHDTIEDCFIQEGDKCRKIVASDIAVRFGDEVAKLVEGVTKLSNIHFDSRKDAQAESLRKMLIATAIDVRVIIIRLSDRLHNIRTLKYMSEESQHRIAEETLKIYAPIAHRLGVWKLKWELEDLSFRALEPDMYKTIQKNVTRTRAEREEIVNTVISTISERLEKLGLKGEVVGRPKHFYSIYNKMNNQEINFHQILDLEAVRIIVSTVSECYSILGEVHSLWLPLPDQFTDYIAKPKPNGYQSLHTKVVGPHGQPLEVQIRTAHMHQVAEMGIAAHWHYKEGTARDKNFDEKLAWIRNLIDMRQESLNNTDWLEDIQSNLFKDQVFVFTPAGDIIDIPVDATPIDFAFRIHTDLGAKCAGARVNGKIVPLNYKFKNGDVAEIIVRASQKPSLDWLKYVVTNTAKSKIKQYFRKANKEVNAKRGEDALHEEAKRQSIDLHEHLEGEKLLKIAEKYNLQTVEDLYALIGYGDITAESVLHKIVGDKPKINYLEHIESTAIDKRGSKDNSLAIHIEADGIDNMLYKISRCCLPIPGDNVQGFVSRGQGIIIHRVDCPNIIAMSETNECERIINLEWKDTGHGSFLAEVEIIAVDRFDIFAMASSILAEHKVPIRSAKMGSNKRKNQATITLQMEVTGKENLNSLLQHINNLPDIIEIRRRLTKKQKRKSTVSQKESDSSVVIG